MIQYALMCGMLSSISRDTAIWRRSSKPVVFEMCSSAVFVGMKRQRDEGDEAVGLILKRPQFHQVIDAVFFVFNVPVEHGAVGMEPQLMRRARDVQPLLAGDFVIADDAADAFGENFRAAAGQRIHARVLQPFEHFARRDFRALRQISDLDHGEGLQMHLREALLQAASIWQYQSSVNSGCRPPTM